MCDLEVKYRPYLQWWANRMSAARERVAFVWKKNSLNEMYSLETTKRDRREDSTFCIVLRISCWIIAIYFYVSDRSSSFELDFFSGALQIKDSEEKDHGKYECVAENPIGTDYSKSALLYVKGELVFF